MAAPHLSLLTLSALVPLIACGYRLVELLVMGAVPPPGQPDDFAITSLTLGGVGLLSGYCIVYAAGLVRWRSALLRAPIGDGDGDGDGDGKA